MADNTPRTFNFPPVPDSREIKDLYRWAEKLKIVLTEELIRLWSQAKTIDENTYIQAESILTEFIKDNAVNVPVAIYTADNISVPSGVETTIQSGSITSSGKPIVIHWGLITFYSTTYYDFAIRLYRDSNLILTLNATEIYSAGKARRQFNFKETPAAGSYTYYLKLYQTMGFTITCQSRSLMIREIKK